MLHGKAVEHFWVRKSLKSSIIEDCNVEKGALGIWWLVSIKIDDRDVLGRDLPTILSAIQSNKTKSF